MTQKLLKSKHIGYPLVEGFSIGHKPLHLSIRKLNLKLHLEYILSKDGFCCSPSDIYLSVHFYDQFVLNLCWVSGVWFVYVQDYINITLKINQKFNKKNKISCMDLKKTWWAVTH